VDTYDGGNRSLGDTGFIYAFPKVAFAPGTLKAVATKGGRVVAQQELPTAGAPAAIRLTLTVHGPQGLQADGSDVALVDFRGRGRAGPPLPDRRGAGGLCRDRARPSGAGASTPRS
jgi:beta-galactosidase